jgi:hypothetical protein
VTSADRTPHDRVEPAPDRPLHAVPRADDHGESPEATELARKSESRDGALVELASENAELYRRVGDLESKLESEKAKFSAWAKEINDRDAKRASQDETWTRREVDLTERVTELERKLDQRADDPGGPHSRREAQESVGRQADKQAPARLWRSNEALGTYAAGGAMLVSAYAEITSQTTIDTATLAGTVGGFAAAAIALIRKRREGSHADRPEN